MKKIFRFIIPFFFPLIVIILGYIACSNIDPLSKQQMSIIFYAPYVILFISVVLAWKFNRSRSFFMSIIFLIILLARYYQEKLMLNMQDVYTLVCILLPFNLLVFTFFKERGIISFWGMLRFAFILSQVCLTYWILTSDKQIVFIQLNKYILMPEATTVLSITYNALLLFILSFIVLIIRIYMYRSSQDISFLAILITLFYMLNVNRPLEYSVFFTVISIILIVTLIKDTYSMAFYDDLTSLPSRRALNQDLMKLGMKYAIAMLDIDFFKKFNDTYGHDTGDEVLKFIAAIIKDVKGGGKVYRYGGEEFTILFPGKSTSDTLTVLEELRENVAKRGFIIRPKRTAKNSGKSKANLRSKGSKSKAKTNKKIYIHVSIGVAQRDDTYRTTAMVLKAADSALYRAKKKGRNCVSK